VTGYRAAAWVALVAAIGVVAALVVLLVRDLVALGASLGALTVAAGAGWFALRRRGGARVTGIVVAAAALGGGVAALVLLDVLDELAALAVATIVFLLATRTALRGAAHETTTATRGTRSGRAVLLLNPRSGGGKVEKFDLVEEAKRRGIEPVLLEKGEDLVARAQEAARSADVLGMAGGDGSQGLVAQVAIEHELEFVCVPAGTRNHFAIDLGLDRNDVAGALDAFTSGRERHVDVAYVNDRVFVNNVSLGVYAEIVRSDAYRDAKWETVEKLLPELLGPGANRFDLRFRGPDGREHRSAQLVLVSNNPYRLDRLAGFGSRERLDTGRLGIVSIDVDDEARAAQLVALEAVRQVTRFPGWREWRAEEFEVDSSEKVAAGVDGEAVTLEPPLRFRIAAGTLRLRLPPNAGLSPAALAPGISGLGRLWGIASGRTAYDPSEQGKR
jgi:diacylglycerol kinase family enzyme